VLLNGFVECSTSPQTSTATQSLVEGHAIELIVCESIMRAALQLVGPAEAFVVVTTDPGKVTPLLGYTAAVQSSAFAQATADKALGKVAGDWLLTRSGLLQEKLAARAPVGAARIAAAQMNAIATKATNARRGGVVELVFSGELSVHKSNAVTTLTL
jgi:hypothetical protein